MKTPSPQQGSSRASIETVQIVRRVVLLVLAIVLGVIVLHITPFWGREGIGRVILSGLGIGLICAAVAGRVWAALYISNRKNQELVTQGPYSLTRNPLYLFSVIGVAGAFMQFGSILVAIVTGLVVYLVFLVTIAQEEKLLLRLYGGTYEQYRRDVPRFWPRSGSPRSEKTLNVTIVPVLRTVLDCSMFYSAVPLSILVNLLQSTYPGFTWFTLP